jgi:hypothetical protein
MNAGTEAAATVDFTRIRYAQVWEDADILLAALEIQTDRYGGLHCLGR